MKKYLLLFSFAAMVIGLSAQPKFKGAIRPVAGEANAFIVSIRPDVAVNQTLTNVIFTFQVPQTVVPQPAINVRENFLSATFPTFTVLPTVIEGGYYNYRVFATSAGAPSTTIPANGVLDILRLSFTGGPIGTSEIRMANLPSGGSLGNFQFYVEGNQGDLTSYTQMFYGSNAVPMAPFADEGVGYASYQYQPLPGISLPTKFLSFFATKNDDVANLIWTVENEENNAYFDVERSLDGRNFGKAYQVQSLRNGRSSNSYTTPDANISRLGVKTIYYRIKQAETSGEITYSEIRQVNLVDKNFIASLYPNPVKTSTKLVIDAPEAGKAMVVIRDAAGKTVKAISLQLVKGINQQQLDATMFAAGDYNVTIVSEKLNQTIKMTKAN